MNPEQVAPLNPIAVAFTVVLAVAILVVPRRHAAVPVLVMASYMTGGQAVSILSLHFSMLRLLLLAGLIRVVLRREFRGLKFNTIDAAVALWMLSSVTVYTILWGSLDALVYKCGYIYDAAGLYFLFRCSIRSVPDVMRISKIASLILAPLALAMLAEKFTGRNVFFVFGGVPLLTDVRDGVLRCQGPFPHSILAGTFGAIWVPFFIGLIWQRQRALGLLGLLSATLITATAGSSGPLLSYVAGAGACAMWLLRHHMRKVRWGIVAGLGVLQLFMKTPVWFVIAHAGVFSGSSSYYRAFLIDRAIANIGEWWLIGTRYPHPWGPLLTDITDMYVRIAMDGGLITLILFFLILKRCFAQVGIGARTRELSRATRQTIWVLGATLFAHTVTFIGVWYWDFNIVNLYLILAMISGAVVLRRTVPAHETTVVDARCGTTMSDCDLPNRLAPADYIA